MRDPRHSPQPRGGWWFSTKAADRRFSFTPVDVGPTNGYWPFLQAQAPVFQGSRSHCFTGQSLCRERREQGHQSRGSWERVIWDTMDQQGHRSQREQPPYPTRRRYCRSQGHLLALPEKTSPLEELSASLPPSSQPGARALGAYAGGVQGVRGALHHPHRVLRLYVDELACGGEQAGDPTARAQPRERRYCGGVVCHEPRCGQSEGPRLRGIYRSLKQRALESPSGEASVKVRRRGLHTPGRAGWQSHREVERA